MAKNIDNYLGYKVGDIITLSDIQTQLEYNNTSSDFTIIECRKYVEPQDVFTAHCYIASYKPDKEEDSRNAMLMIMQVGDEFELRVYTLNMEGPSEDFDPIFDPEEDDLLDRFDVDLHIDEEDIPVTWDRQGPSNFGVETYSSSDSEEEPDCKTIAEYYTEDDAHGNPLCFVEWTGDKEEGYVEVWYGCEIQHTDVEIYKVKD